MRFNELSGAHISSASWGVPFDYDSPTYGPSSYHSHHTCQPATLPPHRRTTPSPRHPSPPTHTTCSSAPAYSIKELSADAYLYQHRDHLMLYAAGNDGGEAYGVGGVVGDAGGAEQLTSTLTNPSQSKNAMVYEGTLYSWLQPTLCHPALPATLLHHSSLRHTTLLSSHPPNYPLLIADM